MRGKPRPSGRERIAPTLQALYTPPVARPTAGQAESNACGDMSSAIRRSAREPSEATCSGATPATGAVGISRLEAGRMSIELDAGLCGCDCLRLSSNA
jgi:hypothetical protein